MLWIEKEVIKPYQMYTLTYFKILRKIANMFKDYPITNSFG